MAFIKKSSSSSSTLWCGSPIRSLCFVKKVFSGRNNFGRITVRHRQSGVQIK